MRQPAGSEATGAAGPAVDPANYELDCPICMQPFLDPVSTSCGHHFCAHCLKRALAPQDLYADDRPQECPICRGLVGVLQPNAGLAVRVSTRFGADYADRRRTDADVPLAKPAVPALGDEARDATRDMILDAVRKQGGYRTLALNSSLDLSGGGWEELPNCLLEFSGLRQLRLEHNLLRSLGDLQLPSLLALSASHNQIQAIGGSLARATQLVRLDLSNNLLAHIDGLPPSLQSLYLAGNRLASASAAEGLAGCVALDVLDLSRNALPLDALGAMGDELRAQVRCLYLTGNPLVEQLSAARGSYRKALILDFSKLHYLDDYPVDPAERSAAEAWTRGGEAGEKAERERQQRERTERVRRNTAFMMDKKRLAMERRAAAELAASQGGGEGGGAAGAGAGAGAAHPTGGASGAAGASSGSSAVASSWSVADVMAAAAAAAAARQAECDRSVPGGDGDATAGRGSGVIGSDVDGGGAQPGTLPSPPPTTTPSVRATAAVRSAQQPLAEPRAAAAAAAARPSPPRPSPPPREAAAPGTAEREQLLTHREPTVTQPELTVTQPELTVTQLVQAGTRRAAAAAAAAVAAPEAATALEPRDTAAARVGASASEACTQETMAAAASVVQTRFVALGAPASAAAAAAVTQPSVDSGRRGGQEAAAGALPKGAGRARAWVRAWDELLIAHARACRFDWDETARGVRAALELESQRRGGGAVGELPPFPAECAARWLELDGSMRPFLE